MRPLPFALVCVLVASVSAAPAKPKKKPPALPELAKAVWIWDSKQALKQGTATCYFRKTLDLREKPAAATVLITTDNGYELYVNGSLVGSDIGAASEHWQSVEKYDVAHLLVKGSNALAVRGTCLGGAAGLLVAVRVDFKQGKALEFHTDRTWRFALASQTGWSHNSFDGSKWSPAAELGPMGIKPWGRLTYPGPRRPGRQTAPPRFVEPGDDFRWPQAVIFLTGRVPDTSTRAPQSIWRIGGSRAYLASDIPAPSVLGRRMYALEPAGPGGKTRLLLDAGAGVIGSPSVSYDGRHIYFSMAPEGEKFFQVYRMSPAGNGKPQRLTNGAFHHYDPVELPDGRIVFSSTRIGHREEYHGNVSSSLFAMAADGSGIRPVTYHIVSDREPVVTANGLLAFVRCDDFLERAKVETQIHVVRPDGTAGVVLMGADRQAIAYDRATGAEQDSRWLRRFGYGSPAPLPDGRVACLSNYGLVISAGGSDPPTRVPAAMRLFDISPLPDGRLLCTVASRAAIGVLDINTGKVARIPTGDLRDVHSAVYLGPRSRPPAVPSVVVDDAPGIDRTGFLYCQDVFAGKQTRADWSRVRAIRVYEGRPLANRAVKHSYVHIGVDAAELGTVPLAPDGSFYVEVPADRALALQAVDAEGRSVVNELSWIYVRPGEQRSCVGCHSRRQSAPEMSRLRLAAKRPPVKLLGRGRPHRFRGNNAANGGVLNLQLDRFREVAAINLHRRPDSTRAADIEAAIKLLGDAPSPDLKISAARRLAIFRDRSAASALAKALRDADGTVRMNAALALSACGGRDAAAPLLKALDDTEPAVAQAANVALENLTGHAEPFNGYAAPAERGADAWRKWVAANSWRSIEESLIARLADPDPTVRHRAVVALGHTGSRETAPKALREFLKNDKRDDLRVTMEAMRALGYLADAEAVGLLQEILEANIKARERRRGSHELGWWQAPAHRAGAAAEALGRIATPQAQAALLDAFAHLNNFWHYTHQTGDHGWLMGCHASVPHFRIAEALDAIESAKAAGIVPALLRSVPMDADRGLLLENDSYEVVAARIVKRSGLAHKVTETALAVLGGAKAAADGKLKPAVTASPPATRGAFCPESRAAQILSVICNDRKYAPRIVAALDRYRATKPSRKRSWVCYYLARTLGKLGDAASAASLIAALGTDATEASFGRPDPPNVFLHNAMTPCYRAAAADALGRIGDGRAVPVLLAAVGNFDNAVDVRHAAAGALAMLADPASLERIQALARDYPEVAIRRILLRACEKAPPRRSARRGWPMADYIVDSASVSGKWRFCVE